MRRRYGFFSFALLALGACENGEARLVPEGQIKGDALPVSLTGQPGNAENGKAVFSDKNRGHCILCHQVNTLDIPFQGNVGPDLSSVGERLSAAQIRLRIVDYQAVRPGALMPSYYRTHDLNQVAAEYRGRSALNAEEVENLVTYLISLKEESE